MSRTRKPRPKCARRDCVQPVKFAGAKFCSKTCVDANRRMARPPCRTCKRPTPLASSTYCGQPCRVAWLTQFRRKCACGCGRVVAHRRSRFASAPGCRQAQSAAAGRRSAEAWLRKRELAAERFVTKGVAYTAGYHAGYAKAMVWWKRRYQRAIARAS